MKQLQTLQANSLWVFISKLFQDIFGMLCPQITNYQQRRKDQLKNVINLHELVKLK